MRAGDANPDQLRYWTEAWLERIKKLYAAYEQLMTAWAAAARTGAGQAQHIDLIWAQPPTQLRAATAAPNRGYRAGVW